MTEQAQDPDDFEDTPQGWAQRWTREMDSSDQFMRKFREQGDECLKRYVDERGANEANEGQTHLNVYWRNIQVQRALLYGRTPSVEVTRKFGDAQDRPAALAGEMQERALNCDIENEGEKGYAAAMGLALDDRLQVALGVARLRYEVELETQPGKEALRGPDGEEMAAAVPERQVKKSESVETDFIHWRDFAYSPCRIWSERRWVGFRNEMARKALFKRFTPSLMKLLGVSEQEARAQILRIPLDAKKANADGSPSRAGEEMDGRKKDPWQRAEVWELWDLESRSVYWWVKGFDVVLDIQEDPYGLKGFFPCARPMLGTLTNSQCTPKADYIILKDLFRQIDEVSRRITLLQQVIRAAGVYDETAGDLAPLMSTGPNKLYPIKNWNRWSEKGGAKGQIDWLPLEQIIEALAQLRDFRNELMSLADQMAGMQDIMRGEANYQAAKATATEQSIKAKYASVRMGALQDDFARFCSETQAIKAELMSLHFDDATYLAKSNAANSFLKQENPQDIQAALQLIRSNQSDYRVEVKPEAIAMQDFAAMKSERTEVIQGIAQFLTAAAPLAQQMPGSTSFLGELLSWFISGIRGSRAIEGELQRALAQMEQAQKAAAMMPHPPAPPDPKVQAQQLKIQGDQQKAQADLQKEQFKLQSNLATIQAETVAKDQEEQSQAHWNTVEAQNKHLIQGPKLTPPAHGAGWVP